MELYHLLSAPAGVFDRLWRHIHEGPPPMKAATVSKSEAKTKHIPIPKIKK